MSSLTDIVAERSLVACALHGDAYTRTEALAILSVFQPSTHELKMLLAGKVPSLHAGIREQALVKALWPVEERLHVLADRLWKAQARRELMRVAMSGTDTEVRRCWAVLRYMEPCPPADDPIETVPTSISDVVVRCREPGEEG